MSAKKDCYGIPSYVDFPDGKRYISKVKCSCCGEKMPCKEVEHVDCGKSYYHECPNGCTNFVWYDLIPEC